MDKFRNKYRIPSARAAWHNYDGGAYFVTICTADRSHYFGKITNGVMKLSEIGIIAQNCFGRIPDYYSFAKIPLFVVMPNHIHAIIIINDNNHDTGTGTNAIHRVSTRNPMICNSLGTVIRGVKARVSRAAHLKNIPFGWQARFHDRIIRDYSEMNRIAKYIENNVAKWDLDKSKWYRRDSSRLYK